MPSLSGYRLLDKDELGILLPCVHLLPRLVRGAEEGEAIKVSVDEGSQQARSRLQPGTVQG